MSGKKSKTDAVPKENQEFNGNKRLTQSTQNAETDLMIGGERFRTIAEVAPAFVWICAPTGENIFFNEKWYEFTGQTHEDAAGYGWTKAIYPEDWDHIGPYWERCQQTGEIYWGETRYRRHDGDWRWFNFRALPLRDSFGVIESWYGISIDIHDKKIAEAELRRSKELLAKELEDTKQLQRLSNRIFEEDDIQILYEAILESAKALMNSDCVSIQSKIPGKAELLLLGHIGFHRESAEFWREVNADSSSTCGQALAKGERVIVADIEDPTSGLNDKDKHACRQSGIVAVQSTLLISRSGKFLGALSTHWRNVHEPSERELNLFDVLVRQVADLMERKQAEEDLKQFNLRLEQQVSERTAALKKSQKDLKNRNRQLQDTIAQLESFNYIASHDLQEPLRKIQTFIELLNEYEISDPEMKEYLMGINVSSARMSDLINSLLQYSRLSRAIDAFQPVDLNKVLDNVKTEFEMAIREKQAIIVSGDLPTIPAIPFQMHQLFANLISNSLKFCERQPHLEIVSRMISDDEMKVEFEFDGKGTYVELIFSDNGIGFDNKYGKKIFEVFQRLHNRITYSGTGIGLSIVDKIVKQHRGFVKAKGGKEGATFTVYLPLN